MPALVFYISGHGFGHASRDVEVLNALHPVPCDVIIRSSVRADLLRRTLQVPYELADTPCDTGIVQSLSISHDDAATVESALEFYRTFDARVDAECHALAPRDVRLIVGDVPPLAFAVAHRLGVRSIALANFTWDWVYETHPGFLPAGADVLQTIRAAYRRATLALELPFSGGFEVFPHVEPIPMIARRARQSRAATRAHFRLPPHARVALLSFGGYGLPSLDLARLDIGPDWIVATTDRVSGAHVAALPHIRVLVEEEFLNGPFRYEDLVAAADVVVTKPGYGILSECASTGTAMLYTSRGHFREYDRLVAAMPGLVRSRFITQADLLAGRWREALDAIVTEPPLPPHDRLNGADAAADVVRRWLAMAS